ncbi:hypothetical protein [Granulicella sp. L60]|uniref:hypothetical protein n=1 Tax=Granulicella sp. L60 TaxID=1641866 RepID=UPI00131C6D88|nr:hypothetical protein [Granulicella sp. L60]
MTAISPEPTRLPYWMRRLWPAYCLLAALATFGYALYDPYQIDGDAVSYMDIADLIRAHNWHAVISGYWNPLYPALLALGQTVFHPTRFTELHAYYMVNFGIFLLQMLAIVVFTDALIQLRTLRETSTAKPTAAPFLLDRYTIRYLGIALLVLSAQRELSMGKVRPDALLQAFLLFALAALLKHLATHHLRYAALLGLALGLAYLTKSFAFAFTLLCILALIIFRILWQRSSPTLAIASGLLALLCFAIITGPYIAALSHQKDRFDIGDSGPLNYAWFVSGTEQMHLQPNQPSLYGTAEVHLKHPQQQLLASPRIYSYRQLPYGTYPNWFDPSYWNDQVKPHMNPRLQIAILKDCTLRNLRFLANHPEPWLLLFLLLLTGARLHREGTPSTNAFWICPIALGLALICIYSTVHVEDRYVTTGFLFLLLPLFASLRLSPSIEAAIPRTAATSAILLLALLAVGESARSVGELRRALINAGSTSGWYQLEIFQAAHALNALGVGPGDTIACVGDRACLRDQYWARLAGVRILTEIDEPAEPLNAAFASMPNRDQALALLRQQDAKLLVGHFKGNSSVSPIWHQLGDSRFYFLPLNPAWP